MNPVGDAVKQTKRAARSTAERRSWGDLLYWSLSAVPVAVVLALPATVVGAAGLHLASAAALNGLIDGRWPNLLHWVPTVHPNLGVEALLAGLIRIMDPGWAVRLVVCVALVGFSLAAAALARSVGAPLMAAVLFLPFQANYLFNEGSLGFVAALPLALGAVALTLRNPVRPPRAKLATFLTAAWLTHLFPAILSLVAIGAIVFIASYTTDVDTTRKFWHATSATITKLTVPVLPTALLTIAWVATTGATSGTLSNPDHSIVGAARKVIAMTYSTWSYVPVEGYFSWAVAGTLYTTAALILAMRIRGARRTGGSAALRVVDGVLVAAVVCSVAAILIPDAHSNGTVFVASRISLFGPIFLITWLLGHARTVESDPLVPLRRAITASFAVVTAVAITVVLAVTAVRLPSQIAIGRDIVKMSAIQDCFPEHATYVQLNLDDESHYSKRATAMVLQSGLIAADRQLLALDNESGWYPYYLWSFTDMARADKKLITARSGAAHTPPEVDIRRAMDNSLPLDTIVIFGRGTAKQELLKNPLTVALDRDLNIYFHRVAASDGDLWELWVRQGVSSPCG